MRWRVSRPVAVLGRRPAPRGGGRARSWRRGAGAPASRPVGCFEVGQDVSLGDAAAGPGGGDLATSTPSSATSRRTAGESGR